MTEEEQLLLRNCGEFCHITTDDWVSEIDASGLDPRCDDSLVLRGGKRDPAVYLCPVANIEGAKDFIGSRAADQPKLYVFRIAAEALSHKKCGPDIGYLVNVVDESGWTVECSLRRGTIACYEAIARSELTGPEEIDNPRYLAPESDSGPSI